MMMDDDPAVEGASVELRVENISRNDCQQLERLFTQWATWRKQQPAYANASDAQLMRGSLQLDVSRLLSDGQLTWQDSLHPVAGQQQLADGGEQLNGGGGGPAYDRGTGELLAPAVVDATLLLPGGAAAAKRRQLAQQASAPADGIDGGGGVFEGGGGGGAGDTPGPKRQRVGMNKCHNCGSYQHVLSNCPAPFDQKRVAAAMAEVRAERAASAPMDPLLQMRVRYFNLPAQAGGGSGGRGESGGGADAPQPGQISEGLAAALGMSSADAPPPWLTRMAVLGVPPRYAEENAAAAAGGGAGGEEAQGGAEQEQLMVVYKGSEDEGDGSDDDAAGSQGVDPGGGGSGSSSGEEEDDEAAFIPFAPADGADAVEGGGGGGGAEAAVAAADLQMSDQLPLEDTGGQPLRSRSPQQQDQQDQQQEGENQQPPAQPQPPPHEQQNGSRPPPKWQFPGINADAPPGSDPDAWLQALSQATWLKSQVF